MGKGVKPEISSSVKLWSSLAGSDISSGRYASRHRNLTEVVEIRKCGMPSLADTDVILEATATSAKIAERGGEEEESKG